MGFLILLHTAMSVSSILLASARANLMKGQPIRNESPFLACFRSKAYVDKSQLLVNVLNTSLARMPPMFITLPRGYGKTVNLHMLIDLLGIVVDEDGKRITPEMHPHYNTFRFKLSIFGNRSFVNEHFWRYPIVHIDLKIMTSTSYDGYVRQLKTVIINSFKHYSWLIETFRRNVTNKSANTEEFLNLYYEMIGNATEGVNRLNHVYKLFVYFLKEYFKERVIILVDEYDYPSSSAVNQNVALEKVNELIKETLSFILDDNEHVCYSILTGISNMLATQQAQGFHFEVHRFLQQSSKLTVHYGFTHWEVNKLFSEFKISAKQRKMAGDWYGGYFREVTGEPIYTPYSIHKYLIDSPTEPISYWRTREKDDFILVKGVHNSKIFPELITLVSGKQITFLESRFYTDDNQMPQSTNTSKHPNQTASEKLPNLSSGLTNYYFTYLKDQGIISRNPKGEVVLPNQEIRSLLMDYISQEKIPAQPLQAAVDSLLNLFNDEETEDTSKLKKSLDELATNIVTIDSFTEREGYPRMTELYARAIFRILVHKAKLKNYELDREVLLVDGTPKKIDIALRGNKTGMIIELGYTNVDQALNQCKQYAYDFRPLRISKRWKTVKYLAVSLEINATFNLKCQVISIEDYLSKVMTAYAKKKETKISAKT